MLALLLWWLFSKILLQTSIIITLNTSITTKLYPSILLLLYLRFINRILFLAWSWSWMSYRTLLGKYILILLLSSFHDTIEFTFRHQSHRIYKFTLCHLNYMISFIYHIWLTNNIILIRYSRVQFPGYIFFYCFSITFNKWLLMTIIWGLNLRTYTDSPLTSSDTLSWIFLILLIILRTIDDFSRYLYISTWILSI